MMLTGRLVYLILLRAFCICGFLWQVTEVAQTFFSYKTTSKVLLNSHEANILPTLQLCMLYTDIMDFDRLNRNEGTRWKRTSEFLEIADAQANLTLKQIMTHVPEISDTITSCTYRNPDGLLMMNSDRKECYDYFAVIRYYVQSFVCYQFQFLGPVNYSSKQAAHSLHHPNILYGVTLNQTFSGADTVQVTVFYGEFPFLSRRYSVSINRLSDFVSRTPRNNVFVFGYSFNRVQLLGAPYDTDCKRVEWGQENTCLENCLAGMEQVLDRITFTTFTYGPIDKKHINYYDLIDVNRSSIIKENIDRCDKQCNLLSCETNYTITYYDLSQRIPGSSDFRAVARTPKAPGLDVKFEAKLALMEFIIYVCSCIGKSFRFCCRTSWQNQPVCMQEYGSGCLSRLSILLKQSFARRFLLRGRICYAGCYLWKRLHDHCFVAGFGDETSDEWQADGCVRHFTQQTLSTNSRWK